MIWPTSDNRRNKTGCRRALLQILSWRAASSCTNRVNLLKSGLGAGLGSWQYTFGVMYANIILTFAHYQGKEFWVILMNHLQWVAIPSKALHAWNKMVLTCEKRPCEFSCARCYDIQQGDQVGQLLIHRLVPTFGLDEEHCRQHMQPYHSLP